MMKRKIIALILCLAFINPANADLVVVVQSAGGVTVGSAVSGGSATQVLFIDGSSNLAGDSDLTFSTDTLTVTKGVFTGITVFGSAEGAANSIAFNSTANCLVGEGTAADAFEHLFCFGNGGLDTTTSIPAVNTTQTIAVLEGTQSFSGAKTFTGGITLTTTLLGTNFTGTATAIRVGNDDFLALGDSAQINFGYNTTMTPDTGWIGTGTTGNSIMLSESGDFNYDFQNGPCGTGACTNPSFIVRDKDQNTTDYQTHSVVGFTGKYTVTLTESNATTVLTIPVADNTSVAGTLHGKVFASDGTDHQARSMLLRYVVVNEADTETCAIGDANGDAATNQTDDGNIAAITSGTLTYDWACTAGTNSVTLTLNAVSSLTQTTLSFEGQNFHVGAGEPLP